jgi:hypothetical protein
LGYGRPAFLARLRAAAFWAAVIGLDFLFGFLESQNAFLVATSFLLFNFFNHFGFGHRYGDGLFTGLHYWSTFTTV